MPVAMGLDRSRRLPVDELKAMDCESPSVQGLPLELATTCLLFRTVHFLPIQILLSPKSGNGSSGTYRFGTFLSASNLYNKNANDNYNLLSTLCLLACLFVILAPKHDPSATGTGARRRDELALWGPYREEFRPSSAHSRLVRVE